MSQARYIVGDALTVLRTMPDNSVDLVLTSPPYLALRSYLSADDPNKAHEMGSEATPGAFIDALLDVTEELRRVLAPHGSLCIELGDTYAGSGGAGGDYNADGLRDGQPKFKQRSGWHRSGAEATERYRNLGAADSGSPNAGRGWPRAKSLTLIPESYRWALAYGRNPFNGRETEPWIVRNVVRHFRPNPPVGALGDKFRPASSEWVVACTGRSRYFDLDAVRNERSPNTHARTAKGVGTRARSGKSADRDGNWASLPELEDTAGAPPLDWWADDDLEWVMAYGRRPSTSEWIVACTNKGRYFDLDAVREAHKHGEAKARGSYSHGQEGNRRGGGDDAFGESVRDIDLNPAGAPPLDWWADDDLEWRDAAGFIEPTAPFKGAHYATFSPKVVARLIKPQCPERVCRVCGEPSRRVVDARYEALSGARKDRAERVHESPRPAIHVATRHTTTLGWTDCGHSDDWRPGVVLDPFCGSGTTLAVATGHGRDAIGIDLDPRNADLAVQRCGMWLTVEHHDVPEVVA